MKTNSFKKEERLCNKRLIGKLFRNGSSFLYYPFRITLSQTLEIDVPAQVIIAVPKRRYKRAVDRNLLKRRIREAYRVNKKDSLYDFLKDQPANLLFAVHYVGKEIHDFKFIESKLRIALHKLQEEYVKFPLGKDH